MKKYLTLLFLVCAVALTFTGCYNSFESAGLSGDGNHSSGGSSGSGSIIGTWYVRQAGASLTLTFKEGGSFSSTNSVTSSASVSGTYTLDGSKVTVRASYVSCTGTYSGSTISFPSDASGGIFAGLTFTKQ